MQGPVSSTVEINGRDLNLSLNLFKLLSLYEHVVALHIVDFQTNSTCVLALLHLYIDAHRNLSMFPMRLNGNIAPLAFVVGSFSSIYKIRTLIANISITSYISAREASTYLFIFIVYCLEMAKNKTICDCLFKKNKEDLQNTAKQYSNFSNPRFTNIR